MRLIYRFLVYMVLGAVSSLLLAQIVAHRPRVLGYTPNHYMFYVQDRAWYGNRWDYATWSIVDLNTDQISTPEMPSDGRFRNPEEILQWVDSDPSANRLLDWGDLPRWVRENKSVHKGEDTRFYAYGWPLRCLQNSVKDSSAGSNAATVTNLFVVDLKQIGLPFELRIPFGIIPFGLVVNSVIHGPGVVFALILLKQLRARIRIRQGLCPSCKYNLLHNHDAGCPECGWNIPEQGSAHENTTEQRPIVQV